MTAAASGSSIAAYGWDMLAKLNVSTTSTVVDVDRLWLAGVAGPLTAMVRRLTLAGTCHVEDLDAYATDVQNRSP
ncbi:unnamed protein product [Peniophora sp. CBMAI 1063]|nr:unnamed protein product [Peniophora sp. CBMAI 1063]